jgi:hypothetical protein
MVADLDHNEAFLIFLSPPKYCTLHDVIEKLRATWIGWDFTAEVLVTLSFLLDVLVGTFSSDLHCVPFSD